MPILVAGVAYLAALLAPRWLPEWGAWAAVPVLAGIAAWAYTRVSRAFAVLAAWPAIHLLLLATGSLTSPLIALAGVWAYLLLREREEWTRPAAAVAALLVPLVAWLFGGTVAWMDLLRHALVMGAGAALALVSIPARRASTDPEAPARKAARTEAAVSDAELTEAAMELVRRATDAQEAALWKMDADEGTAQLRARAAPDGLAEPEPRVSLEGHPFRWAIDEQMPVHLQRGRRDLPSPWAAEMLLVPVELPLGVLALAYPGVVPPGAEATALAAAKHLSALVSLLRMRADSSRSEARTAALRTAVLALPGELELEPFARQLAEAVRAGLGAEGAAVALAPGVSSPFGRILHIAAETGRAPRAAAEFGDGDSRVALSIKHGVDLSYRDLRGESELLPLLAPGEMWVSPPRSAAVIPLVADGEPLGAVAAWHPDPARFGPKEMELLRDLRSIAPPPLRGGLKLDRVEQLAATDSLTGLPNRSTFESRASTAAAYFDRYARPFSMLMLDVDFFKKFNDTHGHEVGDRVLKHVADLLRAGVRDVDLPARLGGEEFVVLMPETSLKQAGDAAERIRRSIEARPLIFGGQPLRITASVGVAACPECTPAAADLLKLADEALYRAKAGGRNRVMLAPKAGRAPEVEI
ncbi:MAG TPA: sensor domain-containing diguanylate cyclase [Longimicrobium sp.]